MRAALVSGLAVSAGRDEWQASLLAGLADDRDPEVRRRVAVTIRRVAPGLAPEVLRQYANDPDGQVRGIAGVELDRLAGTEAR
nr:hypothetical protein GCM10020063_052480 [Dactylosporangium thailandense]